MCVGIEYIHVTLYDTDAGGRERIRQARLGEDIIHKVWSGSRRRLFSLDPNSFASGPSEE